MNRMPIALFALASVILASFYTWVQFYLEVPASRLDPVIIDGPPRHVATSEMARASRAMIGRPARAFSKPATDGKTHRLDEMLGRGPVVLTFIKAGCPCSEAAQPFFNKLRDAYPGASIRGVINVPTEAAKRWAKKFGVTYPLLLDPREEMVRDYGAENSAYVVLINSRGEIAKHWPGYSESMLRELGALLAGMIGSAEKRLDVADAPAELYTGCPYGL